MRLLRISSAIQGKTNLSKYLNRFFKNNGNTDRAFFSILGIIEICHFISCLWFKFSMLFLINYFRYFLAEIEDDPDNWISRQGLSDNSDFEV